MESDTLIQVSQVICIEMNYKLLKNRIEKKNHSVFDKDVCVCVCVYE